MDALVMGLFKLLPFFGPLLGFFVAWLFVAPPEL